jgi:hypothetical protein
LSWPAAVSSTDQAAGWARAGRARPRPRPLQDGRAHADGGGARVHDSDRPLSPAGALRLDERGSCRRREGPPRQLGREVSAPRTSAARSTGRQDEGVDDLEPPRRTTTRRGRRTVTTQTRPTGPRGGAARRRPGSADVCVLDARDAASVRRSRRRPGGGGVLAQRGGPASPASSVVGGVSTRRNATEATPRRQRGAEPSPGRGCGQPSTPRTGRATTDAPRSEPVTGPSGRRRTAGAVQISVVGSGTKGSCAAARLAARCDAAGVVARRPARR